MASPAPLVIAHRGAPGYRPEHSRSAYELAIEMGCDAVEPDVVATKDGVLVVRHENEISGTTDVADHPEFADRHTTKSFLGEVATGWFTEDFTWAELRTLRVRERIPRLRPGSAEFDGREPMLRLGEVLDLVADGATSTGREIGVVVEVKHDAYFRSIGVDLAELVAGELAAFGGRAGSGGRGASGGQVGSGGRTVSGGWAGGPPVTIESFEPGVLDRLMDRGVDARYVFLLEAGGAPADMIAAMGADAPGYARIASTDGLERWVARYDGVSPAKSMILGASPTLVADAHRIGLAVFTWTCRPENAFLTKPFRGRGGRAAFGDYEGEWRAIRDAGVDGVFVDHTDLGIAVFRS